MRITKFIPLLVVTSLASCTQNSFVVDDKAICFDTYVEFKLFEGTESDKDNIHELLTYYDKVSDNYKKVSNVNNVSTINETNEEVEIDERLYLMLKAAFKVQEKATYFNPLCGSLAKAWKESLANKELLDEEVINEELDKMNSSSLIFKEDNVVQRVGEAEIDLGGFAKGYVLDEIYAYLAFHNISHYLVNAGSSSILLGEKNNNDGYFNVGIDSKILPNSYMKLKNCFVSTSSISEQGVQLEEDGPIYSHIINPETGSAINEQDAVIVVSQSGYLGDALSTSMMLNTLEEIKEIESELDVKCIVINNKQITYINSDLKVLSR